MSEYFREVLEPIKGLENCPDCGTKLHRDIFQLPKNGQRGKGRLIEGVACFKCNIIYEILSE